MKVRPWLSSGWGAGLGLACFFLMLGTAAAQWRQSDAVVVETLPTGRVDWTAGLVYSTAQAVPAARGGVHASALEMAIDMARRQLRETLMQLHLDAERTIGSVVQDTVEQQQRLATLVANAEVSETRYLPRGGVESTIQMPLFGPFTALLWPQMPTAADIVEPAGDVVHTGIIIDARGLAIQQALFPQIFDEEGQALYAPARVRAESAQQRGFMVYATAFDSPQIEPRVGKNPLVLRARRVVGRGRVNLIIYQTDALQLQGSAVLRALLGQCRVVIVG
jgi:hypothetical protein